jgi:hypothetical protein
MPRGAAALDLGRCIGVLAVAFEEASVPGSGRALAGHRRRPRALKARGSSRPAARPGRRSLRGASRFSTSCRPSSPHRGRATCWPVSRTRPRRSANGSGCSSGDQGETSLACNQVRRWDSWCGPSSGWPRLPALGHRDSTSRASADPLAGGVAPGRRRSPQTSRRSISSWRRGGRQAHAFAPGTSPCQQSPAGLLSRSRTRAPAGRDARCPRPGVPPGRITSCAVGRHASALDLLLRGASQPPRRHPLREDQAT